MWVIGAILFILPIVGAGLGWMLCRRFSRGVSVLIGWLLGTAFALGPMYSIFMGETDGSVIDKLWYVRLMVLPSSGIALVAAFLFNLRQAK